MHLPVIQYGTTGSLGVRMHVDHSPIGERSRHTKGRRARCFYRKAGTRNSMKRLALNVACATIPAARRPVL